MNDGTAAEVLELLKRRLAWDWERSPDGPRDNPDYLDGEEMAALSRAISIFKALSATSYVEGERG